MRSSLLQHFICLQSQPALCHTWDHLSLSLIPAYKSLSHRQRPCTRPVKVWTKEAILALKDCFEDTDWGVFAEETDLEGHTATLSYINAGVETVSEMKTVKVFPKQKPVALQQGVGPAQIWGPPGLQSMKRQMRDGKHKQRQHIEKHDNNDNSRCRGAEIRTLIYHYGQLHRHKLTRQHIAGHSKPFLFSL